jgi:outer membrane receptor protein involved in Fe transport
MTQQQRVVIQPVSFSTLQPLALAITATLAAHGAHSAETAGGLEEIIVTAQRRTENLQNVPISIQALDTRVLQQLQISNFDSYAKFLPSLSFQTYGPGQTQIYFRGVTNGSDGVTVGAAPLVGVYLDEQPVTTIYNNLDVHIYDIERVEALSGPQGTLFGSSSMAGTLRIITNKPKIGEFEAGYDVGAAQIDSGDFGGSLEGFVNIPLNDRAAIRLVGYTSSDPGYIDNVTPDPLLVYPTSGAVLDNSDRREQNFNDVETTGARAAMTYKVNDDWTVTPTVTWQTQDANGFYAYDEALGERRIARYQPDYNEDAWYQAALTIQGRIGNFDVVYSGGYLDRDIDNGYDYSDYSLGYDTYYSYAPEYFGNFFVDDDGNVIDPSQFTVNRYDYTKQTHEFRISSPQDAKLRWVAGLFLQRQKNDTYSSYRVAGLAVDHSVTGQPGVNYMDGTTRDDLDRAIFADVAFDLGEALTLTLGGRAFDYDSDVVGFFGYGPFYSDRVGEGVDSPAQCLPESIGRNPKQRPCNNVKAETSGSDFTGRANVTYRIDDSKMVYATYSTGFRPGGVNRNPVRPPFGPDELKNHEIGWKTGWADGRVRWNGALFFEKWDDAQFGVAGPNNITETVNAGEAEIMGIESDVQWAATDELMLSASATWLDAELTTNSCQFVNPQFDCSIPGPPAFDGGPPQDNFTLAPAGTRLPLSPEFKMNAIARYEFEWSGFDAFAQAAVVYQTDAIPALPVDDAAVIGKQPSFTTADLSFGVARDSWTLGIYVENVTDELGQVTRYTGCSPSVCFSPLVLTVRPRTYGLTFGQRF